MKIYSFLWFCSSFLNVRLLDEVFWGICVEKDWLFFLVVVCFCFEFVDCFLFWSVFWVWFLGISILWVRRLEVCGWCIVCCWVYLLFFLKLVFELCKNWNWFMLILIFDLWFRFCSFIRSFYWWENFRVNTKLSFTLFVIVIILS